MQNRRGKAIHTWAQGAYVLYGAAERGRTLGAMCEILQCGGGVEELLAEPCVSAHCSQTAVTRRQGRLEY
jgi:hypothetical protein